MACFRITPRERERWVLILITLVHLERWDASITLICILPRIMLLCLQHLNRKILIMNWKRFDLEKPALSQEILVLSNKLITGGYYIARFEFFEGREWIIIKESRLYADRNNWRYPSEFAAWMPLPNSNDIIIEIAENK